MSHKIMLELHMTIPDAVIEADTVAISQNSHIDPSLRPVMQAALVHNQLAHCMQHAVDELTQVAVEGKIIGATAAVRITCPHGVEIAWKQPVMGMIQ